MGISNVFRTEDYANAKVKIVDNSPEEILNLVREVNERLDGKFKLTAEDRNLQVKFKLLFKPGMRCHGFLSRIGASFLKENKLFPK